MGIVYEQLREVQNHLSIENQRTAEDRQRMEGYHNEFLQLTLLSEREWEECKKQMQELREMLTEIRIYGSSNSSPDAEGTVLQGRLGEMTGILTTLWQEREDNRKFWQEQTGYHDITTAHGQQLKELTHEAFRSRNSAEQFTREVGQQLQLWEERESRDLAVIRQDIGMLHTNFATGWE